MRYFEITKAIGTSSILGGNAKLGRVLDEKEIYGYYKYVNGVDWNGNVSKFNYMCVLQIEEIETNAPYIKLDTNIPDSKKFELLSENRKPLLAGPFYLKEGCVYNKNNIPCTGYALTKLKEKYTIEIVKEKSEAQLAVEAAQKNLDEALKALEEEENA